MKQIFPVIAVACCGVWLAVSAAGCGESRKAVSSVSDKPEAGPETPADNHEGHDRDAARPQDLASGIAALRQHHQAIKEAFEQGDAKKADEPLHEVGNVLAALQELAKTSGLSASEAGQLRQSVDKMFELYGGIDEALHAGKPVDYQSVAGQLDEHMAAVGSVAAGSPNLRETAQAQRPLRLAFITCCKDAAFFEPVRKGMQDAAEKMGVECTWLGVAGVDMPAQAALVTQAVQDKYDGIALNLVDPVAFDQVVEQAMRQGVPVVGFNTDDQATPNARLSCVNQRLYEAGRALARHVAADIPDGAHVLMTMHDQGVSSLEDRLRGLQDELQGKNVRWTVRISGNDSAQGAEVIEQELRKEPDIRVVLCTGQADTEAAGRAIEKAFAGQGYWAAGFDLSPTTLRLIKARHIRCTVDQQPYIQGFYPVVQLTHYLRYGIVPASMDAGATIITPESADRVLQLTEQKYR